MLVPKKSCQSSFPNKIRYRTLLNYAYLTSAGLAGAFIDREVETRGVRREDLVAITLPIHILAA